MLRQVLGAVGVSSLLIAAPLSVAGAADMNMPLKAPLAAPQPAYAWTGCYIDGGGGYALWNQDYYIQSTITGAASTTSTAGGRGWMGVFGAGCDYQFSLGGLGNWTIGAFGDYDVMDIEGTNQPQTELIGALGSLSGSVKESNAWFVGARLGYLVTPSLMTYFDGGYTQTRFDQVNFTTMLNGPSFETMPAQTYSGWFLGGGTEYALNFSWLPIHGLFWRNEYRYATYDSATVPIVLSATGLPTDVVEHLTPYVQTVTSSLVWRFNWTGR
ncbi:MAG: porin family protein [Xanthobacteraceae bacterium]